MDFSERIFDLRHESEFNEAALDIFRFQFRQNETFRRYAELLGRDTDAIDHYTKIPFLPNLFFKTQKVKCGTNPVQKTFLSSGTTGSERSRHQVNDLGVYRKSLLRGFERAYGSLSGYDILGLMPSPQQNPDSSLIFMVDEWIRQSDSALSGFYLSRSGELAEILRKKKSSDRKQIVIGLSYALLDFSEAYQFSLPELIIMETGGMKGKRKEMIREELHGLLKMRFSVPAIHSEYGMTELLSQAFSQGNGKFIAPPWMKVVARDPNDPLQFLPSGKTGCLNISDLANFNSCSFIATDDLGKVYEDGSFEVVGRFNSAEMRGCNLMME